MLTGIELSDEQELLLATGSIETDYFLSNRDLLKAAYFISFFILFTLTIYWRRSLYLEESTS